MDDALHGRAALSCRRCGRLGVGDGLRFPLSQTFSSRAEEICTTSRVVRRPLKRGGALGFGLLTLMRPLAGTTTRILLPPDLPLGTSRSAKRGGCTYANTSAIAESGDSRKY